MTTLSDKLKTGTLKRKDRRARLLLVRRDKSGRVVATASSGGVRASSVLSSRGQVVIPSEIRDTLKADKGDRVIFQALDDHTMVGWNDCSCDRRHQTPSPGTTDGNRLMATTDGPQLSALTDGHRLLSTD